MLVRLASCALVALLGCLAGGPAGCTRIGFDPDGSASGDLAADDGRRDGGSDADAGEVPAAGGQIPVVTSFTVANADDGSRIYAAGDRVRIGWTVTDAEGLAAGPVDLYYTVDNTTWTPIVESYGGLSGNPAIYSEVYTGFLAPTGAYFRLKLIATDRDGQTSIPALSDSQNTPGWSVYAGSPDPGVGGGPRGVALVSEENGSHRFAVDPTSGDIYAVSEGVGIVKLDAGTGRVSLFMRQGSSTNLPDSGPLPADPVYDGAAGMVFDADGLLYLALGPWSYTDSKVIYQVDPGSRAVRAYLGGGTANDDTATPGTAFVLSRMMAFDESHTLYFVTSCSPGTWRAESGTIRVLKGAQRPDRTAGAISVFAGNCVRGKPPRPGPGDALTSPLTDSPYPGIGTLAVWDDGKAFYYALYGRGVQKILDGKSYASDIQVSSAATIHYSRATGKLYAANGEVTEHTPNLSGADGDVARVHVAGDGTGSGCHLDGADAAAACADAHFTMTSTRDGVLLYADGGALNTHSTYRVRYRDTEGKVQTRLGALPFHGDGLHRRLLRGHFAGLHYKSAASPNQGAFPAGLYFLDAFAPLLGHIDPQSGVATVLWGNQHQEAVVHPTGTPISSQLSMGGSYFGGNGQPLAFDAQGLPWLRYADVMARVDAAREIVALQGGGGDNWEDAPDGSDPGDYDCWPYALKQNLTLKDQGAFLIGGYLAQTDTLSIRYFDFASHSVTKVMGALPHGASPDSATPGSVKDLSLSASCQWRDNCFVRYRPDEDRLYFGEEGKIRFITTPTDPTSATLGTLFTAGAPVDNFIFSGDGKQVFYVTGSSGTLRCHDLGSGASWCDDTDLGPPAGLSPIHFGPNALTWKSATELLLSTYQGEIYLFTLPATP